MAVFRHASRGVTARNFWLCLTSKKSTVEAIDSKMEDAFKKNFRKVTENLRINWST